MIAYLVLMLAIISRLIPHFFHGVGLNITAVSGGLLFFGAHRPKRQLIAAVLAMAATDVYLTLFVYGYPFHVSDYLLTWAWYGVVCLLGSGLLRKVSTLRVIAAVLSSATGFFLLSNFAVWAEGTMYPHTVAGLGTCYVAGLPFYGNDLVSTGLTAGVLFGLPVLAQQVLRAWDGVSNSTSPLV